MFWKKRQPEDDDEGQPEYKKSGRRIFGFQCSPAIHVSAKSLAKQLHVELFAVSEHSMQLGLVDIVAAMKDPGGTGNAAQASS